MAGIIEVKDQGKVRIYDADNSNYVDIVVPSTVSSNRTITIPDASFTIPTTNTVYTHPNHSGEVTSTADGATVIADNIVDEANLKVSNTPTNGYALTAQSGNTGGLTWAEIGGGKVIQYKHDYDSASIGLSNTNWTDTNLSIAFTPTSSSNRIVLKGMVQCYADGASSYHGNMQYKVLNGSSTVMESYDIYSGYGGNEALFNGMLPFNVYETTAGSTSERTYKVQVRNSDTNSGASYNQYGGYSVLEVWEIDY